MDSTFFDSFSLFQSEFCQTKFQSHLVLAVGIVQESSLETAESFVFVFFQYVCIKLIAKTLIRYQKSKSENNKNKNENKNCLTTIAFPVH